MTRSTHPISVSQFVLLMAVFALGSSESRGEGAVIEPIDYGYRVTVDGQLFTELDLKRYARPILYPVLGPGQTPMTRNWPMQTGVEGEATDHPHQKSLWFAHGDVNGVDFWSEKGRIEYSHTIKVNADPGRPSLTFANRWLDGSGNEVCRDVTTLAFQATPHARIIDWDVTLQATDVDVRLGDTKEGTIAMRTHPNLRLDGRNPNGEPAHAVNSEGITGRGVWGKRAAWVDYWGKIDGRTVGVAIFDHPQNLRHPTHWHARDYGLFAANPFGISDFTGDAAADGSYVIPTGQTLRLRYRFVFHDGDPDAVQIAERYRDYAEGAVAGSSP